MRCGSSSQRPRPLQTHLAQVRARRTTRRFVMSRAAPSVLAVLDIPQDDPVRTRNVELGVAIRWLRRAQGWTIEGLALEAGLHPTYLSGLERGVRNPSWAKLCALADSPQVLDDFSIFWDPRTDPAAKHHLLSLIFERVWLDEQRVVAVQPKPHSGPISRTRPWKPPEKRCVKSGSDGTRTRDLRRDRPAL